MKIPHTCPAVWPAPIAPSRFASLVSTGSPEGCSVAILGLADDLGVKLNGGRPGAKEGPRAFREALARYGVADPHGWEWPKVFDAGDIVPAEGDGEASLHETHRRVTEATGALLDLGLFPVGIGGGHDLTFPFVRAASRRGGGAFEGVYYDAHLDVRETVGSGMGFRKLVEECKVQALTVHGLSPLSNSREHVKWFLEHGGTIARSMPVAAEFKPASAGGRVFVSFDLDVLDGSAAPGVSAVNPSGVQPGFFFTHVFMAGKSEAVACFDLMELNPAFDVDGRTARVAAYFFLTFLRGFSQRAGQHWNPEKAGWAWP